MLVHQDAHSSMEGLIAETFHLNTPWKTTDINPRLACFRAPWDDS